LIGNKHKSPIFLKIETIFKRGKKRTHAMFKKKLKNKAKPRLQQGSFEM
jgi:hypothetical protein